MKKILIAGGAGYIGCALVPALKSRGYDVKVVDLCIFGNNLPPGTPLLGIDLFDLDFRDLEGFDTVIFMAGLSNDPMADYSPSQNFIQNSAAPAFLAYEAKRARVKRFIYASSASVYGDCSGEMVGELSEDTYPVFPYGLSKLQGEFAVLSVADENFSVISLRKGTVSGYSPRMRLDLLVNSMFKSAFATGTIFVNDPAVYRPVLSIQDAVQAYIRAVEASEDLSGVFNIASGNYTVAQVAEQVAARVPMSHPPTVEIVGKKDMRNYRMSIKRAIRELGFEPTGSVWSILEDLIDNKHKFSDWDNKRYYNIEVFKGIK